MAAITKVKTCNHHFMERTDQFNMHLPGKSKIQQSAMSCVVGHEHALEGTRIVRISHKSVLQRRLFVKDWFVVVRREHCSGTLWRRNAWKQDWF